MELFLLIALFAWGVTKAIHDGRIDHTYAKQGLVSPRLEHKYGGKQKATDATARYGLTDYVRDAWSDHWQTASQIRAADRQAQVEARLADGPRQRVSWRERWARAREGMARAGRAAGRKLVEPVGGDTATSPRPEPEPTLRVVDTGDVPEGTRRFTDDGVEEWNGGDWQSVTESDDGAPVEPVDLYDDTPTPTVQPEPVSPEPTSTSSPGPATGGTMTAPTGEAVNYETTVNELEAQAAVQREHLDACIAAEKKADELADAVDGMQETYRSASEAAASHVDHLTNMNLDGTTVGHVADTADALPAGRVDAWFAQIEEVKAAAVERRQAAEVALASTEAALAHVQATYGDAHATVAENLGGDARFLDGGAGTVQAPAAAPAAAEQTRTEQPVAA